MNIEEARKAKGMSKMEVSEWLGIPYRTLSGWEKGQRGCPPYIEKMVVEKIMEGRGDMKVEGIGMIKKEDAMSILTREGREAVKSGDITLEELGEMYKLEQVKKASRIGRCGDTFRANYSRIPEELQKKLAPEELAALTDAFYQCYGEGKNVRE